jgi:hypothetical protein
MSYYFGVADRTGRLNFYGLSSRFVSEYSTHELFAIPLKIVVSG